MYWLDENQKVKWRYFSTYGDMVKYINAFLLGDLYYIGGPLSERWFHKHVKRDGVHGRKSTTSRWLDDSEVPESIRLFRMVTQ